jgi:hypothetical protein
MLFLLVSDPRIVVIFNRLSLRHADLQQFFPVFGVKTGCSG